MQRNTQHVTTVKTTDPAVTRRMKKSLGKKVFLYIEEQDGGMDVHVVTACRDLQHLYGWMGDRTQLEDMALIDWMFMAEVGDVQHHRLGIIVRVKDAVQYERT